MKSKPKVFKTQKGAKASLERMQRAWPNRKFEVVINPQDPRSWLVALMADGGFRVRAYVGRHYKPLPGEAGHPGFATWVVEYGQLVDGELATHPDLVQKIELEIIANAGRHKLASMFKKAMNLKRASGVTEWRPGLYRFRPYGKGMLLLAHRLSDVMDTHAVTLPTAQAAE